MIRLIAAIDEKRGLPPSNPDGQWLLPSDHAYFRRQTERFGGNLLVGHTTFKMFQQPLPGRHSFVITHEELPPRPHVTWVHDLGAFLDELQTDIWVIGGAQIYAQTIDHADELYLTEIATDLQCVVTFPPFADTFTLSKQGDEQLENNLHFRFNVYTSVI